MAPRRSAIQISVEREMPGGDPDRPTRVRLSASLETPGEGGTISAEELGEAIRNLRGELDRAVGGPAPVVRPDRPLAELIQTYRPRQTELVELLHEEGELSDGEHATLREYLATARPPTVPVTPAPAPVARPSVPPAPEPRPAPYSSPVDRPLAAAPLVHENAPTVPRPVPELLSRFQITSLKQAGAVRARRQISFEEYMALKRHFETSASANRPTAPGQ